MVHSLTPEHLALGNGVITNRLNQGRFVVSTHVRYRNKSGKHMLVASFSRRAAKRPFPAVDLNVAEGVGNGYSLNPPERRQYAQEETFHGCHSWQLIAVASRHARTAIERVRKPARYDDLKRFKVGL